MKVDDKLFISVVIFFFKLTFIKTLIYLSNFVQF